MLAKVATCVSAPTHVWPSDPARNQLTTRTFGRAPERTERSRPPEGCSVARAPYGTGDVLIHVAAGAEVLPADFERGRHRSLRLLGRTVFGSLVSVTARKRYDERSCGAVGGHS